MDSSATPVPVRVKGNVKRTVERDVRDGRPVAVKRFHAPGWGAWRDASRARHEAAALRRAAELGLPTPDVVATERVRDGRDGRWSLVTRWIEGARPLDRALDRALPAAGARRVVIARRLGELLARIEEVGMLHPDLHPGNVLVDPSGAPWLIDLARTRFGAPRRAVLGTFVPAASRIRELAGPGFFASVVAAWKAQGGTGIDDPAGALRRMREIRRREVAARVPVWMRTSSATRVVATPDGGREVRVRSAESQGPPAGWRRTTHAADRAECERAWDTIVRATIHRLPCARPVALRLDAPHALTFDAPEGAVGDAVDDRLQHALRDRGLRLDPVRTVEADGRTHVHPSAGLRAIAP